MTFLTTALENGFAGWYLMFGDYAKILDPKRLKRRLNDILEKTKQALFS